MPQPEGPIAEEFTDCFVQHAKAIRSNLQSPPPGKTYHLLVFVHGGLNLEQGRLERAFVDANRMLADRSAAVTAGEATGRLEGGEIWYPCSSPGRPAASRATSTSGSTTTRAITAASTSAS